MVQKIFVMSLVILVNPLLFKVVEVQKSNSRSCSLVGDVSATVHSERNEMCRTVVNVTTILVCEEASNGSEWKEICDETFTQQDAKVLCWELNFSDTGATVSRLEQSISPFPTTFSPECTGQEPNISSCTRTSPPEDCQNVAKLLVTCFTSTSCTSTDAPPASTTNSELPSTTSVASPPHTTSSADSTDPTNTDSITLYTGNLRSNESNSVVGAVLIGGVVGILCLLVLLVVVVVVMVLIYFIVKKECGRKSHRKNANIHDKSDPVDVNEPVSYSELVDAPIEQSQREGPVYETITTNSENTANVSATDSTYLVDLRENMAYEITPVDLEDNVAYDINPVDLKENIAYETSKKITTQTNEAYLVSVARTGM